MRRRLVSPFVLLAILVLATPLLPVSAAEAPRREEVDRLLKAYDEELDDARRGQIMGDLQKVWAEEAPVLLLCQWTSASTFKDGLVNYRPSGTSSEPGPYTWNVHEWRWR